MAQRLPPNFLEMLQENPKGWGNAPPVERSVTEKEPWNYLGEISNIERPQDYMTPVAETIGVPVIPGEGAVMGALARAGRVVRAAPRAAAAAGGLALSALPSAAGEGSGDAAAVKKLQIQMRDEGYYSGKIDGVMGENTKAAKKAYEAAQAEKMKAENERLKIEAGQKETQRLATEAARKSQEREAGAKRLREMEDSETWYGKAAREYGPWAALAAGVLGGYKLRAGAAGKFAAESEAAATKANSYLVGRGQVPPRTGGVNRFWQEGGATEIPFPAAPRGKYAVKSNKQAPSATTLYPPLSTRGKYLQLGDVTKMAGIGAEAGVGQMAASSAHQELIAAQEAVSADPSEANIQRLEAAKNFYAIAEGAAWLGRGAMVGYGAVGVPSKTYRATRPDVNRADAERARLDAIINQTSKTPPPGAKPLPNKRPASGKAK